MRDAITAPLDPGLGVTTLVPVASAEVDVIPHSSFTNQDGNQNVPIDAWWRSLSDVRGGRLLHRFKERRWTPWQVMNGHLVKRSVRGTSCS